MFGFTNSKPFISESKDNQVCIHSGEYPENKVCFDLMMTNEVCIHKVKFYAGDSYWRGLVSEDPKNAKEFFKRFGKSEYEKLILGKETNNQKLEGNDCE